MNEEENFLTIDRLSSMINQKVKRIQKGNLNIQMLEQLLNEVKELQERLIIIKYKVMEKVAKLPVEKNLFSPENFESFQSDVQKSTLNFGLSKKVEKTEVPEIPENQISLIDSIEELSKEEKIAKEKNLKSALRKEDKTKKKKRKKEKKESVLSSAETAKLRQFVEEDGIKGDTVRGQDEISFLDKVKLSFRTNIRTLN